MATPPPQVFINAGTENTKIVHGESSGQFQVCNSGKQRTISDLKSQTPNLKSEISTEWLFSAPLSLPCARGGERFRLHSTARTISRPHSDLE